MTRRSPLQVLARRWWVLLVCALIGAVLALAYSSSESKSYQTTAAIVASPGPKSQNDQYVLQRVPTYPLVLSGNVLLTKVAAQLGPGYSAAQLTGSVTAVNPLNTAVIYVTATASSPARSVSIVKAVIDNGIATINSLESQRIIASEIMQPSLASTVLASRHRGLYVIAGLVVGLAIGAASALLFEFLAPQREWRAKLRRQRPPTEFSDDPNYVAAVASSPAPAAASSVQPDLVDRLMGPLSQTDRRPTPDEAAPAETTPDETTPDETAPDETGPDETTPDEVATESVSDGVDAADERAEQDDAPTEIHVDAPRDIASAGEGGPIGAEAGAKAEDFDEPGPADAADEVDRGAAEPTGELPQAASDAPAQDAEPGGPIETPAVRPVSAVNGSKPASAPINGSKPADTAAEPADASVEPAEPADASVEPAEPAESPRDRRPAVATNGVSHQTFFDQAWLNDLQKRLELDRPFEFTERPTDPKTPQPAEQAETR